MTGIEQIRLKIERADKHIRDLQTAIVAFKETDPYKFAVKEDAESRKLIYYVSRLDPTPSDILLICGDALFNLRGALDYLAIQLFIKNNPNCSSVPRYICFPISESAAKHKAESPRKVEGLSDNAIKAINDIKPHHGGNEGLWHLHALNNLSKHRLLITAAAQYRSVNIGAHIRQAWDGVFDHFPDLFMLPTGMGKFPLEVGDPLVEDAIFAEVNPNMKFRVEISFNEPGIVQCEPVFVSLCQMSKLVSEIVTAFRKLL